MNRYKLLKPFGFLFEAYQDYLTKRFKESLAVNERMSKRRYVNLEFLIKQHNDSRRIHFSYYPDHIRKNWTKKDTQLRHHIQLEANRLHIPVLQLAEKYGIKPLSEHDMIMASIRMRKEKEIAEKKRAERAHNRRFCVVTKRSIHKLAKKALSRCIRPMKPKPRNNKRSIQLG